jgi:hypothetical protein
MMLYSITLAFAVAFPSRPSFSPVSLAVMVSLECRRLLAPSLALALAGTHFPVVSLLQFPFSCVSPVLGKFLSSVCQLCDVIHMYFPVSSRYTAELEHSTWRSSPCSND